MNIIDVVKEHRGDDSSTPEESYNPDNSVDVADVVYTIVYNTNAENVTGTMENQEVKVDEEATLLSNQFSRVGYTFTGWKTEEQLNKSQIYVTTAGWKNTFPYDKLI